MNLEQLTPAHIEDSGWVSTGPNSGYRVIKGSFKIPTADHMPISSQENTMDTTTNHETVARQALLRDVRNHYYQHDENLERKFGIRGDTTPKNIEEALERIKEGKFKIVDKGNRSFFESWFDHVKWMDPNKTKDVDGYRAASEELKKAYAHAQQDVNCDSLDKAKASVRKFEEWKH